MRGLRFALIWLAPMLACAEPEPAFLAAEGRSLILATVSSTGLVELVAYDTSGTQTPITRESGADVGELIALSYDRGLEELGYGAGAIELSSEGGEPLPTSGARIFRLATGDEEPSWAPLESLPASLGALRTVRAEHCASFARRTIAIPDSASDVLTVALSLSPDRGLMVMDGRRLFTLDADGVHRVEPDLAIGGIRSGWFDRDRDEVWLFALSGEVLRGHPDRGFVAAPPVPAIYATMWADGSAPGAPFEIFAVTSSIGVYRFDGTRWEERAPAGSTDVRSLPRIAWSRPGRAIAIGNAANAALEIDGTSVRPISVELTGGGLGAPDTPRVIRRVDPEDTWGLLIGSRSGLLLRQQGDSFRSIKNFPGGRLELITPFRRGIVFGGDDGVLAEVLSDGTLCPAMGYAQTTDQPFAAVLPIGDSLAALHRAANPGPDAAVYVIMLDPS